jgi:hypothetical protein
MWQGEVFWTTNNTDRKILHQKVPVEESFTALKSLFCRKSQCINSLKNFEIKKIPARQDRKKRKKNESAGNFTTLLEAYRIKMTKRTFKV